MTDLGYDNPEYGDHINVTGTRPQNILQTSTNYEPTDLKNQVMIKKYISVEMDLKVIFE